MNRREFSYLSTAFLLSQSTLPPFCLAQNKKPVTLNGGFDFRSTKNGWSLDAHDVKIDGLPIPQYSWQWIGLSVAQGILQGIGGGLFVAIANAIFGGSHQSMEELMKQQLFAFAKIIKAAITDEALRVDQGKVSAYIKLYKAYSRTPSNGNLDVLLHDTALLLGDLGSLGFTGYRTYMTAAGLRLSILQEATKHNLAKAADFEDQRQESVDYHNQTIKYIDDKTNPALIFPPNEPCLSNQFLKKEFHEDILGLPVAGFVVCDSKGHPASVEESSQFIGEDVERFKRNPQDMISAVNGRPVNWVAWAGYRNKFKAENTDLGQMMVNRWNEAKA